MIRDTRENFIGKAREKHGQKFDYSDFEYVNAKTKSIIVCEAHGSFEQSPDKHLQSKHGCPKCALRERVKNRTPSLNFRPKSVSKDEFLSRLGPVDCEIDLTHYNGLTSGFVLVNCKIHGETKTSPQNLLVKKYPCTFCAHENRRKSKTKDFRDFLSKARDIHGDFYTYPNQEYENRKTILTIVCPKHGEFRKKAQKHLAGQGCFECKIELLVLEGRLPGGYSFDLFREKPELGSKDGWVYYLRVGDYYKVGITARSVSDRAKSLKHTSRKPVSVVDTFACTLEEAYAIEQKILGDYSDYRIYRRWSTEIFSEDVLRGQSLASFGQHTLTSTSRVIRSVLR